MELSKLVLMRTEVSSERGVVVAGHVRSAEAGARILERGGNAVDALVAGAFTAYVVEPMMCGVGGSGHLAAYLAQQDTFVAVDHNIRAPAAARPDLYTVDLEATPPNLLGTPGVLGQKNFTGGLAAGVPGAVAGLCGAHERWGRLPLDDVLAPAIEAAEEGVPVDWSLQIWAVDRVADFQAVPSASRHLLRDGLIPPRNETRLDTSALAGTLREIATHGAAGFYEGRIARAVAAAAQSNGGILTEADLAAYRPKVGVERPGCYRGCAYTTACDPLGYEIVNILERFDLARYGPDSVEFRHVMAEAIAHSFADNLAHYGDPAAVESPVAGLCSPEYAAERARAITLDRAAPRPVAPGNPWPYEPEAGRVEREPSIGGIRGTSQVAAADADGNMAALITTLDAAWGSAVLDEETGVWLNNSMQDFDPRPGRANSIAPGKMPMFGAPLFLAARNGRGLLASCGSGGYRIGTGVLHTAVNVLEFGMSVQDAVDAPRVHCQGGETYVDSRIPGDVQRRLAELGHDVVVLAEDPATINFARVTAIHRAEATGRLHGGTQPAFISAAAAL